MTRISHLKPRRPVAAVAVLFIAFAAASASAARPLQSAERFLPESPSEAQVSERAVPETLIRGPVAARLPFRIQSGIIVIPVRINGSKDLRMYLDTGMSAPVVVLFHREAIEELGLKAVRSVVLGGAGNRGSPPAKLAPGATVEVGPIVMKNQNLVVMDESREASEWPVDGIIGKSLFDAYLAEIDYESLVVSFADPATSKVEGAGEPIPLDLSFGMPVIEASIGFAGGRRASLRLVVDIGHRNALFLNGDEAAGIVPPEAAIKTIAGRGVQGVIPARVGRIEKLEIGPHVLAGIPAAFLEPGANPGFRRDSASGNVGSLVWNRFRIVLDYPGKRMYLVPGGCFGKPFDINMAGLVLEQDRDDVYFVRHVVEGSPGFAAGLREGDKIVAVDGRGLREIPSRDVLEIFTAEGNEIRLTVERGGERFEKTVKLRRLI